MPPAVPVPALPPPPPMPASVHSDPAVTDFDNLSITGSSIIILQPPRATEGPGWGIQSAEVE